MKVKAQGEEKQGRKEGNLFLFFLRPDTRERTIYERKNVPVKRQKKLLSCKKFETKGEDKYLKMWKENGKLFKFARRHKVLINQMGSLFDW